MQFVDFLCLNVKNLLFVVKLELNILLLTEQMNKKNSLTYLTLE